MTRTANSQAVGRVHALSVGINAYAHVSQLQGCVNDVTLVSDRLRQLGTTVTTLTDRAANRSGFDDAWRRSTSASNRGDTFIFHFAGHGERLPSEARNPPGSTLGDYILFHGYHPREAPSERLVDSELFEKLIALHRRGVAVLVLLDCCHAGAVTRSPGPIDGRKFRQSNLSLADILAGAARVPRPPPAPPPAELEPILFLAAGRPNELVPEIEFEGRRHGVLSVGFATAIAGAGDVNGDGILDRGELIDHIRATSQAQLSSQAEPVMQPTGRRNEPVLRIGQRGAVSAAASPAPDAAPLVRVAMIHMPAREADALVATIPGSVRVASEWDLLWDAAARQARGPSRDIIAWNTTSSDLPALIERVRAERRLKDLATVNPSVALRLTWPHAPRQGKQDNEEHPEGRELLLRLTGERHPFLLVFNIAGFTVQLVTPDLRQPQIGGGRAFEVLRSVGSCVGAPFGSDLVVALVTEKPIPRLLDRLNELHNKPLAPDLVPAIMAAVADMKWQIGLQTIVTRPNQGDPWDRTCPR